MARGASRHIALDSVFGLMLPRNCFLLTRSSIDQLGCGSRRLPNRQSPRLKNQAAAAAFRVCGMCPGIFMLPVRRRRHRVISSSALMTERLVSQYDSISVIRERFERKKHRRRDRGRWLRNRPPRLALSLARKTRCSCVLVDVILPA